MVDYVSARSFLLVQRDRIGQGRERRGDYRAVDGVMIPFSSVTEPPLLGRIVGTVKEIRFDVR